MNKIRADVAIITLIFLFVLALNFTVPICSAKEQFTPQTSYWADESEGWAMETLGKFALVGLAIIVINFLIFAKIISEYKRSRVLSMVYLHQVMIKDPPTIGPKEPMSNAATLFKENKIYFLPVVTALRHLEGLLSKDDLQKKVSTYHDVDKLEDVVKTPDFLTVNKVMSKDIIALSPYDTLSKAVKLMKNNPVKCIPIIDEEKHVLGLVTEENIVEAINKYMLTTKEDMQGIKIKSRTDHDASEEYSLHGLFNSKKEGPDNSKSDKPDKPESDQTNKSA